jgi:hypothetical protein
LSQWHKVFYLVKQMFTQQKVFDHVPDRRRAFMRGQGVDGRACKSVETIAPPRPDRGSDCCPHALLEFFGGGQRWRTGEFYDRAGNRCLIGALRHVRQRLRIRGDRAAGYLLDALSLQPPDPKVPSLLASKPSLASTISRQVMSACIGLLSIRAPSRKVN